MKNRAKSLREHQWWQLRLLFHDRKPRGCAHFGPFCSPRRFSTGVCWTSRGTQLWQQFAHSPANLLRWNCPEFGGQIHIAIISPIGRYTMKAKWQNSSIILFTKLGGEPNPDNNALTLPSIFLLFCTHESGFYARNRCC